MATMAQRRAMRAKSKTPSASFGDTVAHRGYLITLTLHGYAVTCDGFRICWATSIEDAKAKIDALLD